VGRQRAFQKGSLKTLENLLKGGTDYEKGNGRWDAGEYPWHDGGFESQITTGEHFSKTIGVVSKKTKPL
jgi:hypothetical protein